MLIDLLLMVLKLVPVLLVVISELLAEEKFDRSVFADLLGTLASSV